MLKPLKASISDAAAINATDRDPRLLALASEANRIAKRMRTGPAWEQRVSIMRRFGDFTKRHRLEMSQGNVPIFSEFEAGEKQLRAVYMGVAVADGSREGAGSDVSLGPSEGRSMKFHKAGAANDAVGAGPRLRRDGVREGPRCCAARVGHGGLLWGNWAAGEERIYRAPERPRRSYRRLGRSSKNIQGRPGQSSTLRSDRGHGCHHGEKGCCKNGDL
ncbi:hypothetical protein TRVL_08311 [Trypanosoma vivax]|nr:hypothetical protein TRVL_08311 [Trypanosoma vivax]